MRPNIGLVNALIRITCGFTVLAWATSKLVRRRNNDTMPFIVAMLGGMKIAEGITRFCPIVYLFEETREYYDDHEDEHYEDYAPLNPS
ncbi:MULTISPECIES: YgaP family membrane protein [Bacillaceae]|uniref:DUF2892 domain-containing protein n=1 Tax=Evansella alkalicola TaxID=745819 RepID=A0ABS6JU96_9BACI|nr:MULTISPECIES: DUF2892 domain-containing protein [Bacillaceae]MBU9721259.1 DUF2892 domain-containing protein [Bacillus alkalicola]